MDSFEFENFCTDFFRFIVHERSIGHFPESHLRYQPFHTKNNNFILAKNAVISKPTLFERLNGSDLTIESILLDCTDWQQKIIDAHPRKDDPEVKEAITYYSWMKTNKMLAKRLSAEYDSVFKIIMGN